ncbi:MAG: hypothetical protein U1F42_08060 [Candidatus Competibacteraceae bacterium]
MFTVISGQVRAPFAALDARTGTATAWNPKAGPDPDPVEGDGPPDFCFSCFRQYSLYIGWVVHHHRRTNAPIDCCPQRQNWYCHYLESEHNNEGYVIGTLVSSGKTVYAGGSFTTIGGQARNGIAALNSSTGVAIPWNLNADGGVSALAVAGKAVYAGGNFTLINNVPRSSFAALPAVQRHPRQSQFPELEEPELEELELEGW